MSWNYLLRHLGHWRGSFTRLSPAGVIETDTPSLVTLDGLNTNQSIRQVVQQFDPITQAMTSEKVLQYEALSRSFLIFPAGAFSQGSMQLSPVAEFGAESGFVHGDRRLRLVQLFHAGGALAQITLIREWREGTASADRPDLTMTDLLGTWQGESVTYFPDLRPPETCATQVEISQVGQHIQQCLQSAEFQLTSTATLTGNRLVFDHSVQGASPVQVLLLPDGASCNCPQQVRLGKPFFLEVGWLLEPTLRQRLIRRYDAQGGWQSLTLITEHRVAQALPPAQN